MTKKNLLRAGWVRVKEFLLAVMAAALMYGGLHQILGVLKYILSGLALGIINAGIRNNFHDSLTLSNPYTGIPWQYQARVAAVGATVMVVGMFLGLWAHARSHRPAP